MHRHPLISLAILLIVAPLSSAADGPFSPGRLTFVDPARGPQDYFILEYTDGEARILTPTSPFVLEGVYALGTAEGASREQTQGGRSLVVELQGKRWRARILWKGRVVDEFTSVLLPMDAKGAIFLAGGLPLDKPGDRYPLMVVLPQEDSEKVELRRHEAYIEYVGPTRFEVGGQGREIRRYRLAFSGLAARFAPVYQILVDPTTGHTLAFGVEGKSQARVR